MNRRYPLALVLVFCVCVSAFGRGGNIQRGGLGVLFPDHNSFVNPGQFAVTHGLAVEGLYTRTNQPGLPQSATPSFVFGNGRWGLGVLASRFGTNLGSASESSDSLGAGLGISLLKERITVGGSYARMIGAGQTNGGVATGSVTFQGVNRKGPSLGVTYTQQINNSSAPKSGVVGIGYQFRSNTAIEANVNFQDLSAFSNYVAAFYGVIGNDSVYASAGYQYAKLAAMSSLTARFGFVLAHSVDFSLLAAYPLASGSPVTYGGSLRFSF